MWEDVLTKTVGLLIEKALGRLGQSRDPRKRLATAFVSLFRSITSCHEAYLATKISNHETYSAMQKIEGHDFEKLVANADVLRVQWGKSVIRLARNIEKICLLLEIRDPELLEALREYHLSEELHFRPPKAFLKQPPHLGRILVAFDSNTMDGHGFAKLGEYNAVISRLRNFMQDDLKLTAEEIMSS